MISGTNPWSKVFGERGINRFWSRVIIIALIICGLALVGLLTGVFAPERKVSQVQYKDGCPGYEASNVTTSTHSLTADLTLAGPGCNTFGHDLKDLKLKVEYQTGK